jgi:iron(III) transport system ATP-binding protein
MSIRVEGLTKRFGDKLVIDDVSFVAAAGEFVSLLGPSGCGKTTTLRCVAGLETPDAGRVEIGDHVVFDAAKGVAVPPHQRNLGMVFQSYAIWPHLTVFENVAFPLQIRKLPKSEVARRVAEALRLVGLAEFEGRKSSELSGGQQQRVAVARAIVQSPAAMLLDEPLSNLDAKLRDRTRAEIHRLQRALGIAAMYVTHDQAEALALSDRVLVMSEGRVVQEGTPRQIYEEPADEFVADVVGAANFIDVTSEPAGPGAARVSLPGGASLEVKRGSISGGVARLMLRPDRIAIAGADAPETLPPARMRGTVRQRLYQGSHFEYVVAIEGEASLRVFAREEIPEGASVLLGIDGRDCVLIGGDRGKGGRARHAGNIAAV